MSLFFSQISKLSAWRNNARFFSSLSQFSCLLLGSMTLLEFPEGKIVNQLFFNPAKEEIVCSREKKLPKELDGQIFVGASQGWVASVNNKDLTVHLTDLHKPWVSSPRLVSLPSLEFKPSTYAPKISLSTSDPVQDQDFTVAAKFNESRLSVCRPCSGSKWTHFETAYSILPASDLMYSKRDRAFYFTSFKGLFMGALDLNNKRLEYQQLRLRNLPKIPEAGWEMLDQCFMSKHLVESPSGELFFIKWYTQCIPTPYTLKDGEYEVIHNITKRFMVFREDGKSKDFCYTEDIGDLCIFLGKSKAFCLSASMYPGLKPNSVYYMGPGLGSYDLASGTVRTYNPSGAPSLIRTPFWLHPTDPIA